MKIGKGIILMGLILILAKASYAASPPDAIASQVNKWADVAAQNLTQKAVEDVSQGNLTQEHLQQEFNATKEQIQQKAKEIIKQQVNNTTEQIQQKAKEEINKQVNKSLPGFELIFASASILLIARLFRRHV